MLGSWLRRYGPPLLAAALFALVVAILHRELHHIQLHQVVSYVRSIPPWKVAASVLLSALSYLVLSGYDALSLAFLRHWIPYRRIALASFTSYVVNHNLGPMLLGGSAVRYRLYSSWGLSAVEIAQVIAFTALTFWLGFFALAGVVMLGEPQEIASTFHLDPSFVLLLGGMFPIIVAAYLLWCFRGKPPLELRSWKVDPPKPWLGVAQIALSFVDWLVASSVLWVLLPEGTGLGFALFFGAFLLGQVLGVASSLPAGLGVFEASILLALGGHVPHADLLGALLAYRVVYYALPLVVATLLLGGHELVRHPEQTAKVGRLLGRWIPEIVPQALAITTFLAGVLLLAGGSTAAAPDQLEHLSRFVPLVVLDLSSFLASVVGMALLLLARGLQLRLNAAYGVTLALLGVGAITALVGGYNVQEAIVLGCAFLALLPCRRHFYRRAALLDEPLTPGWTVAVILVLVGAGWLLLFSYKHVEYRDQLWWQFELYGQASRGMRALAGAAVVFVVYGIMRLLRPSPPDPTRPSADEWTRIHEAVAESPRASAHLALLGDKTFLASPSQRSFLMYGVSGRSFVAMGDPIGPAEESRDLVWRFRELVDRHGGWPVFYEVGQTNLPLYVDLGLTLLKIGEEARVPLDDFDLKGPARARLRQAQNRGCRDGYSFEVLPAPRVGEIMPELQAISDAWLADKNTREKGFSLGRFDPAYLRLLPVALVRCEGRPIAFANLWLGGQGEEMSLDLMRHVPGGPSVLMDFLFTEVLLWGREHGYRWFNFGLAPLSGMESHSLAPLWSRAGAVLFRHGEHFYNFQGLRHYKDKFDPEWSPRYLASPGGLALPRILAHIASLVSGGLKGVVTK